MGSLSRRRILTAGAAALAATAVGTEAERLLRRPDARTTHAEHASRASQTTARPQARTGPPRGRLIGDGSTMDTGPQPHQPVPERLEPGSRPPQFVVFSWDGAGEDDNQLFSHFRQVAQETKATMTFFLSGIYTLPRSQRMLYNPPRKPQGSSAIGYLNDDHVKATIQQTGAAWLDGHEIGTHFNGHFCDALSGVGTWTPDQWRSEIDQAVDFVRTWKTNTGFADVEPLPFDYGKELTGGRTPCLLGRDQLLPVARDLGWTYDASSPGGLQIWPAKRTGVWDFPLQSIPFPGHTYEVLSMDYNMLYNQVGGDFAQGDPAKRPYWRQQAAASYMAGFNRAYTTNRAPFFIGNHFEDWNGGIYMNAVEDALRQMATKPDVRLVSFRQLASWLEAQDPTVIARLRTLAPGVAPNDWRDYTTPKPTTAEAADPSLTSTSA